MRTYLAVSPGEAQEAGRYGQGLAHVAYRIGPGSTLLRQNLLLETRGGLLSVSDRDAPLVEDPQALAAAVLRECGRRGYSGAVLDFEERPRRDRAAFVEQLGKVLGSSRRQLYLPEAYAGAAPGGITLLCTALSGGSFAEYLQEQANAHGGAGRLALDVQRLRMDFRLPAPSGEGRPLTQEELEALLAEEGRTVFFSHDLCARYFTYTRHGEAHFVLFDDGDTLRQKLQTGQKIGFAAAFLMWPEIQDVIAKIFPHPSANRRQHK